MFSSVMQDKFPARDAFVQYAFVARGHSIVMLQTPTHSTAETFDRVIKQTVQCTILLHFVERLNLLQKNNAAPWVTEMRWLFKEGASDVARHTLRSNCVWFYCWHTTWGICCPDWTRKSTVSPALRMASTACSWLASRRSTPLTLAKSKHRDSEQKYFYPYKWK